MIKKIIKAVINIFIMVVVASIVVLILGQHLFNPKVVDYVEPQEVTLDSNAIEVINKTAESSATITFVPAYRRVYTTAELPLKDAKSDSSNTIHIIPQYEILNIQITENSSWAYVTYNGNSGYIGTKDLHSYEDKNYLADLGLEFYYQDLVKELIEIYELDVDEYFFYGMMYTESRFTHNTESSLGAQGILQIVPSTWESLYSNFCEDYPDLVTTVPDDVNNKRSNITLGVYYIKFIMDNHGLESLSENAHQVLTIYNRGSSGAKNYYESCGTYESAYSKKILRAAEYIRVNHVWKEGL